MENILLDNNTMANILQELPFASIVDMDLPEPDLNTLNYNSSKFNSLTCPDIDDIPEGDISNFFNGIDPDMNYQNNTNIKEAEYISESKLKGKMRTWSSKVSNITLFYMNARSLNKHMDEINILIDNPKFKFTILCFTETWLNDETSDLSSIKGYTDVHTFRNTKSGGGVSIYI